MILVGKNGVEFPLFFVFYFLVKDGIFRYTGLNPSDLVYFPYISIKLNRWLPYISVDQYDLLRNWNYITTQLVQHPKLGIKLYVLN